MSKVFVRGEKHQIVAQTQLGKQCVNGADLDPCLTTCVAQGCRINMVFAIWLEQRQGGKAFDDLGLRLGAREALQEFLENQARGDDDL